MADAVEFPGAIPHDRLMAEYQGCDAFCCMSEHEGFCLPLIEAMAFDLPIVAYAGAAIPDTLGDAGVLIHRKRYGIIAGIVDVLSTDYALREKLLDTQRQRLKSYERDRVTSSLRAVLSQYLPALS